MPFLAGLELVDRHEDEIVDREDLGLIMGGGVDFSAMLATVGAMYGPMGLPTGPIEERLSHVNRGDLWWADQQYEELRAAYRAATS